MQKQFARCMLTRFISVDNSFRKSTRVNSLSYKSLKLLLFSWSKHSFIPLWNVTFIFFYGSSLPASTLFHWELKVQKTVDAGSSGTPHITQGLLSQHRLLWKRGTCDTSSSDLATMCDTILFFPKLSTRKSCLVQNAYHVYKTPFKIALTVLCQNKY